MISLGMSCKSTLSGNTILIELLAIGPPQDLQQTLKFYICYYMQYFYVKRYKNITIIYSVLVKKQKFKGETLAA
jgi:hypothetical protein